MGIDMGIVVFKFGSNWGGDFTCLYRVSYVFGPPEAGSIANVSRYAYMGRSRPRRHDGRRETRGLERRYKCRKYDVLTMLTTPVMCRTI